MAIGTVIEPTSLVLTKGRDFKWSFKSLDDDGQPKNFPPGTLYFEILTNPVTVWTFTIDGSVANLKIESPQVDLIPARTRWQLVFRNTGEAAGGDPVARGIVRIQE